MQTVRSGIGSAHWRCWAVRIMFDSMSSNITTENRTSDERDPRSGRFLTGNNGGPGRRVGSRNRLSEQFIADLRSDWEQHGPAVIETVRRNDPSTYLRVIAALVPRAGQLDVNVGVDVVLF